MTADLSKKDRAERIEHRVKVLLLYAHALALCRIRRKYIRRRSQDVSGEKFNILLMAVHCSDHPVIPYVEGMGGAYI
jgi:hypothetical protein